MSIELRKDYERLVLLGLKRVADTKGNPLLNDGDAHALERLIGAGLAAREDHAVVLRPPRDAAPSLDDTTTDLLETLHALWLRMDDGNPADDEILYGELGYWQHWWNALNDGTDRTTQPLHMDLLLPERGSFLSRQWTRDLDPQIVEHVFSQQLVQVRVIVPPATFGSVAEAVVAASIARGVRVRVYPSSTEFALYDGECAVVRDEQHPDDLERHRLIRRPALVEPLVQLFEARWAAAVPWESFVRGSLGILQLLAQGWTDARIADAIGASPRTVSRRIAELMDSAGAQSRFQLGMKYALHEIQES